MSTWGLRLIAVVVAATGLYCELESGGWGSILGMFVVWPLASVMHLVAHFRKLPRDGSAWRRLILIAVSHLLFVSAFLLQYDIGDGPDWLIFTELLGHPRVPGWWPAKAINPLILNLVVFLPVLATRVLLIKRSLSNSKQAQEGDAAHCLIASRVPFRPDP
jgi:hypothetical protein